MIYEDINSINFWSKSNHFGTVVKKDENVSLLIDNHSELINVLLLTKQAWNFMNKQERTV